MSHRIPITPSADPAILGEHLNFPTSKRQTRNRFLKAALTEKLCFYDKNQPQKSGIPTKRLINLHSKWAHGGFGVILTGNVAIDWNHPEVPGNTIIDKSLDSEERRTAFKKLAETMKSGGSLAVVQLSHAGRLTPIAINERPFSASDVQMQIPTTSLKAGYGVPIPLTQEQIKTEVIEKFVYAAKFCYESGFDGIELHGAHGYLLSQFISPSTNKRDDRYGGPAENRARLVLEIYKAIRTEIPAETGFIVGIKMNSVEFQDQGLEVDDAVVMCKEFEKHDFDFIELSGGTRGKGNQYIGFQHQKESTRKREAFFIEFANKIKPALTKTIIYLTGGFRTVPGMIDAIQEGVTDGIGLGRPITAEPDLPNKILHHGVQSALISPLEGDSLVGTKLNNSQMWQAGESSCEETNGDPCYGIMDLSTQDASNDYKKALVEYLENFAQKSNNGKIPIVDVFEYKIENGA
uniref:NADH:flavin oxidoreductase/NADH oxidase N-terminal domain-containing protein n=1 Tax=Acrobeloides nanus TaxID=290746 RepID=A0A914DMX6_9BILA